MITLKEFFSTLGLGLWQAVCYIFRAFNPSNKTKFWRVIWAAFAACVSIFTLVFVYMFITEEVIEKEHPWCRKWLSKNVYVYNYDEDYSQYIRNYTTGDKIAKEVEWFQVPENGDEIAVFCERSKRGYFNWQTGELIVKPKYDKAWVFSEGYAAVCADDSLFFIDKTGKEYYKELGLCRERSDYSPDYIFRNGLCIVGNRKGQKGVLKSDGTWALPMRYDEIERNSQLKLWQVSVNGYKALIGDNMSEVFGGDFLLLEAVDAEHIYVMPKEGGVKQRYNLKGELLDACVICSTQQLTYTTDKLVRVQTDDGICETIPEEDVATCLSYFVCAGHQGLMSKSGKIITAAIYNNISAIGKDLYRCEFDDDHSIILNSQGQKVN